MSDTIIRVENLSKKYQLNHKQSEKYVALRDVVTDYTRQIKTRLLGCQEKSTQSDEDFWALKNISFEVRRGDRVGIIGGNGAGKSTLLKILSRITEPTAGFAEIKGRVASLLEVGTGFHPELTGRENIFLNGAILGLEKTETSRKFDEIVSFAEIERFIDIPVKRYSSGMYVRLAFAVAAHLEPDILIIDEVLAVGDIKFQKKCIGKMEESSRAGRTILLVSHHMSSVSSLCNKAIMLKDGEIFLQGKSDFVIERYFKESDSSEAHFTWDVRRRDSESVVQFVNSSISNKNGDVASVFDVRDEFYINLEYEVVKPIQGLRLGFMIKNQEGVIMCGSNTPIVTIKSQLPGIYSTQCRFPNYTLNSGRYSIMFGADSLPNFERLFTSEYCLSFVVEDVEGHGYLKEQLPGLLRPNLNWSTSFNM